MYARVHFSIVGAAALVEARLAAMFVAKFGDRYRSNVALGVRAGSRPGVIARGAVATTYAVLFSLIFLAFNGGDW